MSAHKRKAMPSISRRQFLRSAPIALGTATAFLGGCATSGPRPSSSRIMTVRGPIAAAELGVTLPHEHVTTDFLGAEKARTPRYDRALAFSTILPELIRLRERGCNALFECTPNYIGRDVSLLLRLAVASGMQIVTNTGYYGAVNNKYLPQHAHTESVDQLAGRWLSESQDGIEGTGIRPGFIKLGTGQGKLPELHAKLVRAAARVHLESGLTIAIHTGNGEAALDELRILREAGVASNAYVWVHAQNDSGAVQIEVARLGGWVSLDGVNSALRNLERYRNLLLALKQQGLLHRVLVSHDDGWAVEGESPANSTLKLFGNGNPRPYETIFTRFLPDLRQAGFTEDEMDLLLRRNPREAFTLNVRRA